MATIKKQGNSLVHTELSRESQGHRRRMQSGDLGLDLEHRRLLNMFSRGAEPVPHSTLQQQLLSPGA